MLERAESRRRAEGVGAWGWVSDSLGKKIPSLVSVQRDELHERRPNGRSFLIVLIINVTQSQQRTRRRSKYQYQICA